MRAAGIGTFDWDMRDGALTGDQQMHELLDGELSTVGGPIDFLETRLHPDDVARIRAVISAAVDARKEFELEYRVLCRDGATRVVRSRGRVLVDEHGEPCRLLGTAHDVTAATDAEARVARLLEQMPEAFYAVDRDWCFTFVNPAAEALLRTGRDELLGHCLWDLFPAFRGSVSERYLQQAMTTGQPVVFEQHHTSGAHPMTFELRAWPGPEGLSVHASDVTERRQVERQAALSAQRTALLASLSAALAGTLDGHEMMCRLARLVVPELADWSMVSLLDAEGPDRWRRVQDVASWHPDPARRPLLEEFAALRVAQMVPAADALQQVLGGDQLTLTSGAAQVIADTLDCDRARELLRELRPASVRLLPLRVHGRTLGLLSLFSEQVDAPLDMVLATQVAERTALVLDNARLYAEQRRLAEGLQRSMLTAPPQLDQVQIVARYESAAAVAQVGGDWYDAFQQRDGATVLVIGDVVGHDTVAAAAMGQLRGLLRAIAARAADPPITVLTELDAVMEVLEVGTSATAVVARLEQDADRPTRDGTVLRWSNAGHPPPMVILPSGAVLVLDPRVEHGADLLLGFDPGTDRTESTLVLPPGSTVLMYTDGLVERRTQSLDDGLDRLRGVLAELHDLPLETLCDQVLHRMLPEEPEDDVALIAVRLNRVRAHRQHGTSGAAPG